MQNSTEISTNSSGMVNLFTLYLTNCEFFINHLGHFLCSKAGIQDFAYAIVLINVVNNCHYCH